jgi:hypothetical protein
VGLSTTQPTACKPSGVAIARGSGASRTRVGSVAHAVDSARLRRDVDRHFRRDDLPVARFEQGGGAPVRRVVVTSAPECQDALDAVGAEKHRSTQPAALRTPFTRLRSNM